MLPKAAHIRISQSYGKVNRTVVLRTINKAKNVTVSKNVSEPPQFRNNFIHF